MKTKLNSETMLAGRMTFIAGNRAKAACILFLALLLSANHVKAQTTGVLTGTGMGVCSSFSFNSTVSQPIIKPLNYGSQNYACTGLTDNDISFNPQGTSWRVQWLSWTFAPSTSAGATLDGFDPSGNAMTQVSISTGSWIAPVSYATVNLVKCVYFQINGGGTIYGPYNRSNWYITAP